MTWLAGIVGERLAKPVLIIGIVLAVIASFALVRCTASDPVAKQAQQTTRSDVATATAATAAIGQLTKRVATDQAIDDATATARKDINDATDPSAVRDAVIAGVCRSPSHKHDPVCY